MYCVLHTVAVLYYMYTTPCTVQCAALGTVYFVLLLILLIIIYVLHLVLYNDPEVLLGSLLRDKGTGGQVSILMLQLTVQC